MKCTFCGSRIDANDEFCSNCGTPVKGMAIPPSGGENAGGVFHGDTNGTAYGSNSGNRGNSGYNTTSNNTYGNENNNYGSYGSSYSKGSANTGYSTGYGRRNPDISESSFSNYQSNLGVTQVRRSKTSGKSIFSIILVLVIVVGGGFFRFYYKNLRVKTVNGNGYSIEMAGTMKKTTNTEFTVLDAYSSSDMTFVLEKIDYTDLQMLGYGAGMTTDQMFGLLQNASTSAVSFERCDGSYLYFSQNTRGKKISGICRMIEGNQGYYFFEFGCEIDKKSKYESKFKKWLGTAKLS